MVVLFDDVGYKTLALGVVVERQLLRGRLRRLASRGRAPTPRVARVGRAPTPRVAGRAGADAASSRSAGRRRREWPVGPAPAP